MKVALIGGTGFVGSYLIDELIKNEHTPRLLVRKNSDYKVMQSDKCEIITGDIDNDNALKDTLEGCDAVIYLIALIREFPKKGLTNEKLQFRGSEKVAKIAEELKVNRFLLMSALGANPNPNGSKYMQAKHLSEQAIKNTKLSWTIMRPSSLFGDPRGGDRPEFCMMLDKLMLNLVPYPKFLPFPAPSFFTGASPLNSGQYALSMVHVKDVASIFVKALSDEKTIGQTIEIGGKKEVTWNEIIKSIASVTGQKVFMLPAPFFVIFSVAGLLDRFEWFPAGQDQLKDLVKGSVCNSDELFKKYEIEPIPFNTENLSYLRT
tara:strand:- start:3604 stop:4560 length:957 start_codon:yes stop_codon:yes gene_type:complete